jgi:hypothetical protein
MTVFAICGRPLAGQDTHVGRLLTDPGGTTVRSQVACKSGLVPLSGGPFAFTGSDSTAVSLNTTAPSQTHAAWVSWVNNPGEESGGVETFVTCAEAG